ncbi:MAG TPA: hypothetical protein VMU85_01930 [Stellaceae bacterium]|nr:hypothetical protein [Stellaceae bacterium]
MTELMDTVTEVDISMPAPGAPVVTTHSGRGSEIPLPLVARLVAKLVAGRPTEASEIPGLVLTVSATVALLLNPPPAPVEIEVVAKEPAPPRARRSTGRRPGRPRKEAAAAVPEIPEAPAPPPMPRLVRRAEAVAAPPAPDIAILEVPSDGTVRGVVRWFDPARQTGGLRLTGVPEDVALDPPVFAATGVTRLFKGQEIEATVSRVGGRVHVTRLKIPGGPAAPMVSGPIAASNGRKPRMVMVEKKRDALRRVAARSEAEHLLGAPGAPKPSR